MRINLNNPGTSLTKQEAASINTKYEQYLFFTVEGYGEDDSKIKIKLKQASHAINLFNTHLKTGSVVGKHISRSNDTIVERL
jgi:hypothetical protein